MYIVGLSYGITAYFIFPHSISTLYVNFSVAFAVFKSTSHPVGLKAPFNV